METPRAVGEWISAVAHPLTARRPDAGVALAELIEHFHATSVAAGYDFDAGSAAAADAIMQARHATGRRSSTGKGWRTRRTPPRLA